MEASTQSTLLERDRRHVWHPFTQHLTAADPLVIVRGQGACLYDEEGREYVDATSSWWVNLHGHGRPEILQAIFEQGQRLEHVLFAGCTHPAAVELAEGLLGLLPAHLSRVFYSDNGSTSVEAAIKMVIQYWHNVCQPRQKVVALRGGYHGDTFGAMAAAGRNLFNRPFWPFLFEVETLDPPVVGYEQQSRQHFETIVCRGDVACFIYEPLILGAGGMRLYSSPGLQSLTDLCRHHGVLTIADEVMTGFGRTGPLFASAPYCPDLVCLSKGLTGGFLPLGVTVCTDAIYRRFLSHDLSQAFLHGHSYTANALACAAAVASLALTKDCAAQREEIARSHRTFCDRMRGHPKLARCESLGTILIWEYRTANSQTYFHPMSDRIRRYFVERGVIVRPLGNVLYLMPPYCITQDQLQRLYTIMTHSLEDL